MKAWVLAMEICFVGLLLESGFQLVALQIGWVESVDLALESTVEDLFFINGVIFDFACDWLNWLQC